MNVSVLSRFGMISFLVTALVLIFQGPAAAYIDPGTGSYAFQMAIAGLVGAVYTVKLFWRRFVQNFMRFLGRSKGGPDAV